MVAEQKSTRVADRAFPDGKITWRQTGDFGRYPTEDEHQMNHPTQCTVYIVSVLAMSASILLCSECTAETPRPDLAVIEFSSKTLKLNKREIKHPFALSEIVAAIGKPDRSTPKLNVVHTWDQYGIVAIQKTPNDPIHAFQIIYRDCSPEFAPEKPFAGAVQINRTRITSSSGPRELSHAGFTQNRLLTYYYTAELDGVSLIAKYENKFCNIEIAD